MRPHPISGARPGGHRPVSGSGERGRMDLGPIRPAARRGDPRRRCSQARVQPSVLTINSRTGNYLARLACRTPWLPAGTSQVCSPQPTAFNPTGASC